MIIGKAGVTMKQTILIRQASPEDAEAILRIYAYYVRHTAITFEYDVPTAEAFAQRIRHTLQKYPYLAAVQNGTIVGYAYAGAFKDRAAYDWAVETTVYVDHTLKGCGIGKALYAALEHALYEMGITNLYACIGVPAEPDAYLTEDSLRFHQHMGYQPLGTFHQCGYKFGTWYNMVWAEKCIREHPTEPTHILPFDQINRSWLWDGAYFK